ncbi:hypothetical protein [Leptospira stimsonii]|nr:hypothetical protein [Leptospira stimsonii]
MSNSMSRDILTILAIAITFYAFFPYIQNVYRGETKPHIFSWIIWGSTTLIVFFAQLSANAGIGAWPIGVSAVISIYIAVLAFQRKADQSITLKDWIFFLFAIGALPIWYFSSDPLWAVVCLTIVDVLGFGPTLRKAYAFPFDENVFFFFLFFVRNMISIGALESLSITTVLFPATIGFCCLFLILLILVRRRVKDAK